MSRARQAQGRRALLQIALGRAQLDGLLLAHMPSYLHMLTTRALHLAGSHARRGKDGSAALFEVEMESPVTWGLRGSLSGRRTSWSIPCAEQRRTGRPASPPMMSDGAGQTQSRSRLLRPSAQRYLKSAATIPIVFQHGDNQIAGGWAILSAHRQARRHAVGF